MSTEYEPVTGVWRVRGDSVGLNRPRPGGGAKSKGKKGRGGGLGRI